MNHRFLRILLLFSFAILNVSCHSKSGKRKAKATVNTLSSEKDFLQVTKVVDGDTFWVDNGTEKRVKIRLIGIDAPESKNAFKKKKGYYGAEAKAYLSHLLTNKSVRLEYDVNRIDRYGRTLAYSYLQDGTFVNAELVKNGYAMVMTVPPNVKYADKFAVLQQEAKANNRGLWKMNQE